MLAPELVIASGGGRGEELVEVLDREDGGSGQDVNVSGLEITVTFNDGSEVTFTTPP